MANTITLDDLPAGAIYSYPPSGTNIPVSGSYTASGSPPSIQWQTVDATTATVVNAWSTLVASPSGGSFSTGIRIPRYNGKLKLQVRFSDASAQANGSNAFMVGYLFGFIGQSNMFNLYAAGVSSGAPTPNALTGVYFAFCQRVTIAAAASWTTSNNTITMSAGPGSVVAGMIVFDNTIGQQIGKVNTYDGTLLTLNANAAYASSGSSDSLTFTNPSNAEYPVYDGWNTPFGWGIINCLNALNTLLGYPCGAVCAAVGGTGLDNAFAPLNWLNTASIAAAASWATSNNAITMSAGSPGLPAAAGSPVYDQTTGKVIGTVATYSGNTLTLNADAAFASAGSSDLLSFCGIQANFPGDYLWGNFRDAVAATGNDLDATCWYQGEQDAGGQIPYSSYFPDLGVLLSNLLGVLPNRTTSNHKLIVGVVAATANPSSPASLPDIRAAQINFAKNTAGAQLGPCAYDLYVPAHTTDDVHIDYFQQAHMGFRWAQCIGFTLNALPWPATSPLITGVTRSGVQLILSVQHDIPSPGFSGTAVQSPISGFQVFTGDLSTELDIVNSVISVVSGVVQIVLQLAGDPGGQVAVRYQYEWPPNLDLSALVEFSPTPVYDVTWVPGAQDTIGVPLGHIMGTSPLGRSNSGTLFTDELAALNVFTLPGLGWDVVRTEMWDTNVQENISGKQVATSYYSNPKHQWELTFNLIRNSTAFPEWATFAGFFNGLAGRNGTFLFEDPDDNSVTGQFIAISNGGAVYQLTRTQGASTEDILAPNLGILFTVYVNGVATTGTNFPCNLTAWNNTINQPPGRLIFTGELPPVGAIITIDYSYYFPCRFDDDKMSFRKFMQNLRDNKKVTFTSVK